MTNIETSTWNSLTVILCKCKHNPQKNLLEYFTSISVCGMVITIETAVHDSNGSIFSPFYEFRISIGSLLFFPSSPNNSWLSLMNHIILFTLLQLSVVLSTFTSFNFSLTSDLFHSTRFFLFAPHERYNSHIPCQSSLNVYVRITFSKPNVKFCSVIKFYDSVVNERDRYAMKQKLL